MSRIDANELSGASLTGGADVAGAGWPPPHPNPMSIAAAGTSRFTRFLEVPKGKRLTTGKA
jgi:hypothetical protein